MVGLSSFVALAVASVLWLALRDDAYVVPPREGAPTQRMDGAADALQSLVRAIEQASPSDAAALGSDDDRVAKRLAALVTNARDIPLTDVALRYVDEIEGSEETGEWSATVETTWRVAGSDQRVSSVDVRFDFASVDGQTVISGVGGTGGATPVWMSTALDVRRVERVVVMAAAKVERYTAFATRAVNVVRRVLPAWDGSLVVEVPRDGAGVDDALEVERGTFRNVAGVTASVDGEAGESAPVHVLLNPDQMRRLRPFAAQVVVSHEAVHVATNAPASELPMWLSEGFADYVALRDVDLPLTTTAGQVIDQVRRDGVPRRLPGDNDFDEQSDRFGATYEAAWLACRLLAQQESEQTLLRLYRRAERSADFARAFRRIVKTELEVFTRDWQASLQSLAQ